MSKNLCKQGVHSPMHSTVRLAPSVEQLTLLPSAELPDAIAVHHMISTMFSQAFKHGPYQKGCQAHWQTLSRGIKEQRMLQQPMTVYKKKLRVCLSTSMATAMQALYPCVLSMLITGRCATHECNTLQPGMYICLPCAASGHTWRLVLHMHTYLFVLRSVSQVVQTCP